MSHIFRAFSAWLHVRSQCPHEWEYLPREFGEDYTGYCEKCRRCNEIVQIVQ